MRIRFVLQEIGIGLRRNLTMTVAVIVSVAVSLTLFGLALLIRAQVSPPSVDLYTPPKLEPPAPCWSWTLGFCPP